MRILLINNILANYPASKLGVVPSPMGGWLQAMAQELVKNSGINLAIAAPGNVKKINIFNDGKFTYYVIPSALSIENNKKIWKEIIDTFKPDVIHLNGTELPHARGIFSVKGSIKTVVSIQGLVSEYQKHYYSGLSSIDIVSNITLKDVVRHSSIFDQKIRMKKSGIGELNVLKSADIIIGRTDWDYAACVKNDVANKYHCVNENLRDSFYQYRWDINKCNRHTIFCSQGVMPYKGIHVVFAAIPIIKKRYPDVKLIVAGYNLLQRDTLRQKILTSGYAKYLTKLIKSLNISDSIVFTGQLQEEEMCHEYLKANVVVQASYIENSPNSLGEAILLHMPIVASFVGGTAKYIKHEESGYLYPAGDSNLLAYYVMKLFGNDDLAIGFGEKAYESSATYYDRIKNAEDTIAIYHELLEK